MEISSRSRLLSVIFSGLLKSSEESKVVMVISSTVNEFSFEELIEIGESIFNYNKKVVPVFCWVDSVHVENQSSNVEQTRSKSQKPSSSNAPASISPEILRKGLEDTVKRAPAPGREREERQSTSHKAKVNNDDADAEMRKREVQAVVDQIKQLEKQRLK